MPSIQVGHPTPDFTATTSSGKVISLSDYRDHQPVVLFFYPRDNSPICTKEACAFRDAYEQFVAYGAIVIGISSDSDDRHRNFVQRCQLPYELISDADGRLRTLYGVPASLFVLPGRVTFVIDKTGIVRHIFNSQFFGTKHVEESLQALAQL